MQKGKSIWSIAIRSRIETLLGFIAFPLFGLIIAFPLLRRVLNLRNLLISFVPGAMWVVGIYIAQYSYKATYQQMTYGQGVKVGFWTAFFMALWTSLLVSGGIVLDGKEVTFGFLGGQGATLGPLLQQGLPAGLAGSYGSLWVVLGVFMVVLMIGTLTSVIFGLFLRGKNNQWEYIKYI
jgi:hypothetical protein